MPRTVPGVAPIRILAVESDLATCWVISKTMAEAGHHLTLASHGEEGLRLATRLRPDLLILDAVQPRMEGLNLVRALRNSPETALIPAIFLAPRHSLEDHLRIGREHGQHRLEVARADAFVEALDVRLEELLAKRLRWSPIPARTNRSEPRR